MTDRELLQMALDALNNFDKGNHGMRWQVPIIKALRSRLANEFNPDWNAMSVMVEEQQSMAKRIEELESALASKSIYCGCGDEIVNGDGARCGTCVAVKYKEKEWQGLTDKDYEAMAEKCVTNCYFDTLKYARAIEARLRDKNS